MPRRRVIAQWNNVAGRLDCRTRPDTEIKDTMYCGCKHCCCLIGEERKTEHRNKLQNQLAKGIIDYKNIAATDLENKG